MPSASLGRSGAAAPREARAPSTGRALRAMARLESLRSGAEPVADADALKRAVERVPAVRRLVSEASQGTLSAQEARMLAEQTTALENLLGMAVKGRHRIASYRPPEGVSVGRDGMPEGSGAGSEAPAGLSKTNTGWILDQHLFDPGATDTFPTLNYDYKHFDEGRNDITMGHSDHPTANTMFGWVWQVHAFYWTDTTTVPDHANPSYCLFVVVSYDGGFTWQLYNILYDATGVGHATSRDLIHPRLAMDITGADDRFYLAYEYCAGSDDHDVYVYSETSVLDGGEANAQDVPIATSLFMERNPAIASDYTTGETSYRVVVYEYAPGGADCDLYAAQSTGDGSAWTDPPVAVAADAGLETNPALTAGSTGDGVGVPFEAFMHLAYNYDTYTAAGSQVLQNPGFESGANGDWTIQSSGGYAVIENDANARSGSFVAWLDGYTGADESCCQEVTLPPGVDGATLSFWIKIASNDTAGEPRDIFYADVRDGSDALLQNLVTLSNLDAAAFAEYAQLTFDLSAFRGRTVRICFRGTNDGTSGTSTSFFVDDTALDEGVVNTASEVRYKKAPHPGAHSYPDGFAGSVAVTVLAGAGGAEAWPYGPPAIAATHGGSDTVPGGRLLVAADQFFPENQLNPGDPARFQLVYAVNLCNGDDTCGSLPWLSPDVTLGWSGAFLIEDKAADYRYPSLVVDGIGWVEGDSGVPQNGVALWPEVFLAYHFRDLQSGEDLGSVQMLLADASDESAEGFASGAWYVLTDSPKASDDDDSVAAEPGTIAAFNYFYGWPGVCFNKRLNHLGAGMNDDAYFTTLGDNYVIDTLSGGKHIDAYYLYNGDSYVGPWTFAWPAGYEMTVTADATASCDGTDYAFSMWSSGERTTELTILTNYCGYGGTCPDTSINALYTEVGAPPLRVPFGAVPTQVGTANQGVDLTVTWDATNCGSPGYHLIYGRGENLASWTLEGGECGLGTSGTYAWSNVPDPSAYTSRFLWFLVVGDDGQGTEGSWGLTYPEGAEEGGTTASNLCGMTTKDLSGTCGMP